MEEVEFNLDEMDRLNMLMNAPFNDCVCKHPVPIKNYIEKFYYGDMLHIATNMIGICIYLGIRKCQNYGKVRKYEFTLDSRPNDTSLPRDGMRYQYLDILLVQNYLFCLALLAEEWITWREYETKIEA